MSNENCYWNHNKPCPYEVRIIGWGTASLVKGSMKCCKIRQTNIQIAKSISDDRFPNFVGDKSGAIEAVNKHKKNYPEEHQMLFGDDE